MYFKEGEQRGCTDVMDSDKDSFSFEGEPGLHFMHLNVRSLADIKKVDMIKLQFRNSGAHLIGLSETWLKDEIPDSLLRIEGYNISRLDRAELREDGTRKRGGGVAVYCRDDNFQIINSRSLISVTLTLKCSG